MISTLEFDLYVEFLKHENSSLFVHFFSSSVFSDLKSAKNGRKKKTNTICPPTTNIIAVGIFLKKHNTFKMFKYQFIYYSFAR